ncbi:hypothetical protein C0J08_09925 [Marinomonas sp. CT5]|nr:MipA/OmpV family protein [Oceanospirillaceae bacterium]QUX95710.1 hypothetical protein C0J08_09925 [Marinomonas sp. CT5]
MKMRTLVTTTKWSAPILLASVSLFANATELNANLGLSLLGEQNHVIGEDNDVKIHPYLNVQYGMFIVGPEGIGLTKKVGTNDQFSSVFLMRESVFDKEDNDLLKHFDKRDDATELALQWTHYTPIVDITTAISTDVSNTHEGYEAKLMLSKKLQTRLGTFIPAAAIQHQSDELVDYYYGVSSKESNSRFSAYKGEAATNTNLSLTHVYPITAKWHLATRVAYDHLGEAIADSPIVKRSNYWSGAFSVFYQF